MGSNISVKVSGITNLTSARYFAARNVDYLGFCIDPESPVYCPPGKITEIISWVEGPDFVLETNHFISDNFIIDDNKTIDYLHVNTLQGVHSTRSWKKVFVNLPIEQIQHSEIPDLITPVVQSSRHPDEISASLLDKLSKICTQRECYLDLTWRSPQETFDFLQKTNCFGIVLHGSDDIKTGLQDFDWMDDFFDLIQL